MATEEQFKNLIEGINQISNDINECLTEKLGDLEVSLDEANLKETASIGGIFNRLSEYEHKINSDLNQIKKILIIVLRHRKNN